MRFLISHLVCVLLAATFASAAGCARGPRVAVVAESGDLRAVLSVQIADDADSRAMGLMYRHELAPDAGMLFVFAQPHPASFWMKNTSIPLDLIFADASGRVIGVIEKAEPFSESPLSVKGLSKFVLEVNAGAAARLGVRAGDRLEFRGFTPKARD